MWVVLLMHLIHRTSSDQDHAPDPVRRMCCAIYLSHLDVNTWVKYEQAWVNSQQDVFCCFVVFLKTSWRSWERSIEDWLGSSLLFTSPCLFPKEPRKQPGCWLHNNNPAESRKTSVGAVNLEDQQSNVVMAIVSWPSQLWKEASSCTLLCVAVSVTLLYSLDNGHVLLRREWTPRVCPEDQALHWLWINHQPR